MLGRKLPVSSDASDGAARSGCYGTPARAVRAATAQAESRRRIQRIEFRRHVHQRRTDARRMTRNGCSMGTRFSRLTTSIPDW